MTKNPLLLKDRKDEYTWIESANPVLPSVEKACGREMSEWSLMLISPRGPAWLKNERKTIAIIHQL